MAGSIYQIMDFITAKTPEGLRQLMFENNAKYMTEFQYRDIQFVKGKWFAWYQRDIKRDLRNKEVADDNK